MAYLTSALRWFFGLALTAFWTAVVVPVTMVIGIQRALPLWRFAFRTMMAVFGIHLKVYGREHIDPAKGYIYMSNHVNLFEPFAAAVAFPAHCVALEKASNFKIPVYNALIKAYGNIPIVRENFEEAMKALEIAKQTLASGVSIQVMPEGTRSRDGNLLPFKKGGFHMAIDTGAMIVPYAFRGMFEYNRTGSFLLRPGTVEIVFTEPIDASTYSKDQLQELSDLVKARIQATLDAPSQALEGLSLPQVERA